ncbi:sodium-coupled monocarboxylate transporter 1-like [Rhopilema esculentum]|uniref:sodium-coupled monocarboxylate transporter 1-like n=1 Tax=Rhopilema esculentum TaxID=499914 RepID=UPI0031E2E5A3
MADTLSAVDYVVFALMLLFSSVIGIYYGYKGKQTTTKEYLTASGSMHWMPISISLLASFLSAIALMGIPSEIYTYGIQYLITYLSFVAMLLLSAMIYAPIFYQTKVTSANEYLEKRFSRGVRLVGCALFILQYILYLAVVIFAPSLALQAVAGVPMAASIISTGAVCTFYTTLGGMRAVVWTDVFQAFVMILGLVVIIAIGTNDVGGIGKVIDLADKGERLTLFDFNPDPTVRNTFWTLVVGGTFSLIPNWTTSQVVVQRFLSASSLKSVKKAIYINVIFLFIFVVACCFAGLVMYAVYADCDLRTVKEIKSNDQVIPYFVVHKLSHLTGVPGLYTACLFSGALSTASSGLNSLTAVTVEDIVKPRYPDMSASKMMLVSKLIACAFGIAVIACSFLASVAGTLVLQLAYSITGIIGAPNFGMFTLGMFSTRAHSKGALVGVFTGIAMTTWISLGGIMYPGDKAPAPLKVNDCSAVGFFNTSLLKNVGINGTVIYNYKPHDVPLAKLYSLSYLWYGAVGALCTIVIGWLVSVATNSSDQHKKVDESLLFDYKSKIQRILPARWTKFRLKQDIATDASTYELKHYADVADAQKMELQRNDVMVFENQSAQ